MCWDANWVVDVRCSDRQYRHHWCSCGRLCGILGLQAEASGGWDYGGCEEFLVVDVEGEGMKGGRCEGRVTGQVL